MRLRLRTTRLADLETPVPEARTRTPPPQMLTTVKHQTLETRSATPSTLDSTLNTFEVIQNLGAKQTQNPELANTVVRKQDPAGSLRTPSFKTRVNLIRSRSPRDPWTPHIAGLGQAAPEPRHASWAIECC